MPVIFQIDGESRSPGGFFVTYVTRRRDKQHKSFNRSAEVFNTAEEKFVEKRELTLVTFCQRIAFNILHRIGC